MLELKSCAKKQSEFNNINFHQKFISSIITETYGEKTPDTILLFTINTSFCGSCTEKVLKYYTDPIFIPFEKIYITDLETGETIDKVKNISHSKIITISIHEQEKEGVFSTYNKIYILKNGKIIYANFVTDNNLKNITKFVNHL